MESCDNIGNIVICDGASLIVKAKAISFHIVEPHLVGAAVARFCKDHDGGRNTRIGLEHARGHGYNSLEAVELYDLLTDRLVCLGRAKQNAIGNDGRATTANLEGFEEERHKEQLGL